MEESGQDSRRGKKRIIAAAVFAVVGVVGIVSVLLYVRHTRTHITTDDAFVEGRLHMVAAKVPGTVKSVLVRDNQFVRKGELLLEIDPADFDVRAREAEAAVLAERSRLSEARTSRETAGLQFSELEYRMRSARANLELHEARLTQAESDFRRAEVLFRKETISRERSEQMKTGYDVAAAERKAARELLGQAEAALATQKGKTEEAEAAVQSRKAAIVQKEAGLEAARLQQGYTRVVAPADGYVTRKSVEPGNQIQAGQPLMAVVPLDDTWIIANYKETQLDRIVPGQGVEIRVDSFPGKTFTGRVESIMAGTGSAFSLFPPENATGNFVKVVQRIPVKIVLDPETDAGRVLRVGMSVVPTVLVETR